VLWEVGGSLQCSLLGTCLSEDDLLGAIRKGWRLAASRSFLL
jgi:hypothetical protein